LDSACKAYVVCNMQGGERPTPTATEASAGIKCGVMPTASAGMQDENLAFAVGKKGNCRGMSSRCGDGDSVTAMSNATYPYGERVFELDVG
jgi:hypothetical protein